MGVVMETLFHSELTTKILHYLQYKFTQRISAAAVFITLLQRLDFGLLISAQANWYLNKPKVFISLFLNGILITYYLFNFSLGELSWPPNPPILLSI